MPKRHPLILFALVAGVGLSVLLADRTIHRPRQIPAPAYADSMAGVVVRVTGKGDSADVARVTWWQSPESWLGLNWVGTEEYAYRGEGEPATAPIAGRADLKTWRITVAKGQLSPWLAKHEMAHLFAQEPHHPPTLFGPLERYAGR